MACSPHLVSGLIALQEHQPANPVRFLADWLLDGLDRRVTEREGRRAQDEEAASGRLQRRERRRERKERARQRREKLAAKTQREARLARQQKPRHETDTPPLNRVTGDEAVADMSHLAPGDDWFEEDKAPVSSKAHEVRASALADAATSASSSSSSAEEEGEGPRFEPQRGGQTWTAAPAEGPDDVVASTRASQQERLLSALLHGEQVFLARLSAVQEVYADPLWGLIRAAESEREHGARRRAAQRSAGGDHGDGDAGRDDAAGADAFALSALTHRLLFGDIVALVETHRAVVAALRACAESWQETHTIGRTFIELLPYVVAGCCGMLGVL